MPDALVDLERELGRAEDEGRRSGGADGGLEKGGSLSTDLGSAAREVEAFHELEAGL